MKHLPIALLSLLMACCTVDRPCIQPPPISDDQQHSIALGVSASLISAPISGSLTTNFTNVVNTKYDTLVDNDKALFLFLTAIECYLKEGEAGQEIAKSMATLVQNKWAAREAPPTARVSIPALLTKVDTRTPDLAPRIHSILKKVGLE